MGERDQIQYRDLVEGNMVHLKLMENHVYLSKFTLELKINWRFNSRGRLDLINIKLKDGSQNNGFHDLVRIPKTSAAANRRDWKSSEVFLYPLPREIDCISYKFVKMNDYAKYIKLTGIGHCWAGKCHKNILERNFPPPHVNRRAWQLPFSDIDKSSEISQILEDASNIFPKLQMLTSATGIIEYERYTPHTSRP